MNFLETPVMKRIAHQVEINELGLAYLLTRHPVLRVAAEVVLLDYGLYIWHVLTHKIPFLESEGETVEVP